MVEFRVLGSLEVVDRDGPLALGAPKQRALLAVLLLHRGEAVSTDRLVDEIWGEQPPASANKLVQGYVSNLRKALGGGLLVTERGGYALRVEPGQVDVDRFETVAAQGQGALEDGDAVTAAAVLREALGMWRGPPLADFAYEPFAQAEIARLEESRMTALEDRIDADLATGEQARLVGELEALVREHPLRERLRGQLMLALYRSGRQADALQAYRDARRDLLDELGLEPGRALQELERAILTQDSALEPSSRRFKQGVSAAARKRRRGPMLIVAGGIVLLAAIIVVTLRLAGSGVRSVAVAPNSLAAIDVGTNRVAAAVAVGARPGAVASGSGSLWVGNLDDQTVSRVDPGTLSTLATIPVGSPPTGIATSAGGVWVVGSNLNPGAYTGPSSVIVRRVDPDFDTLSAKVRIGNVVPAGPGAVAAQGSSVWVAPSTGLLTRIDAVTGAMAQQLDPNASPAGIAIGEGAVWVSDNEANNVVRVDPTGLLTPISVGHGPTGIAVGAGGVWVADSLDDAAVRIDPETRSVKATIPVGRSPAGVAFGAGSVWVANSGDGTVTRIDPQSDKVQATITVGGSPQALTIAAGKVWVAVDAQSIAPTPTGSGGGTLRMVSSSDAGFMDPALPASPPLLYATCAQLVNYPDRAGAAGSQLTAEVAQALPTRSADGRTYTFKIRRGFQFSPGSKQSVTAETFKRSIERTLNPRMRSPWAYTMADVVGARAYMAGNASHIAGIAASADTLTIRLLAPAPDFLARIAEPAFCAVPTNTPINPNGVRLIPSAGPYYVTSYTPGQGVVLARNPNYRGSRPRHFARIQLAVGISTARAVAEIEAGSADYVLGLQTNSTTLAALASQLASRYGPRSAAAARGTQRYFINPGLQLDFFFLNTHRPLFSDAHMRQAVNYAINRRALARQGDAFQPLPERLTDHYLPPAMPGFRDAHVYPMQPDVVKARALAHGGGRTAVLYTCDAFPCPVQAQIVKSDLAKIGLRVQIKTLPLPKLVAREATPGEPFDLAWAGWVSDYADPQAMLSSILHDSSVGPTFNDPAYRRKLAGAARLSGPERYLTYGKLDLDLARNAAPLAAFGNLTSNDFFSARIGCQTYGIYGMDLAALCTKRTRT
jgi:YVTN family beta-propeller protein